MELRTLRYFLAVAQEKNITRAPCFKGGRGRLCFLKIRMQRQTAQVLINFLSASGIPASSER